MILSDTEYNIGISVSVVSEKTEQEWEALPYDYYCVDENGDIYDLDNVDEEARGLCIHEFRNGSIIDHQEDGKWNVQLKLITRRFVSSVDLRRLRY